MRVSATYRPPYWPKCPCSSGSLGAADELLDLRMILPSRTLLDARGHVDAEGSKTPDRLRDRLGSESARHEETRARHGTEVDDRLERDAGPAGPPGDVAVEQDVVGRVARGERRGVVSGAEPERLDGPPGPIAAVGRVLVAVKLHGRQTDLRRNPFDQLPRRVHEDTDERRRRHRLGDLAGARQVDTARASGPEVEAQEIRPCPHGYPRVLDAAHAADLDLHGHASHSARAAPGSGRSMKASPTRTACAPARRMRSTSARERMPLSATTSTPPGTSPASRSVVSSETANVARSRLLMPTNVAPAASAQASSASPWTSTSTSSPLSAATARREAPSSGASAAAISSTASAPQARASSTW